MARLEESALQNEKGGARVSWWACKQRAPHLQATFIRIRHGENAAENGEETPYGDPGKEVRLFRPGTTPVSACFRDAR